MPNNLILYTSCILTYILCIILSIIKFKFTNYKHTNLYQLESKSYYYLIIFAWLQHGLTIILPWNDGIYFGFAHSLSIMSWCGLGLYLLENKYPNMLIMRLIMLCISASCVGLPYFFPGKIISHASQTSLIFIIHFIYMNLTYAILLWILAHLMIMHTMEKYLAKPNLNLAKVLDKFPPLLYMRSILMQRLYILWICMTIVLTSGIYLWNIQLGLIHLSHKVVLSLVSWIIFSWFLWRKSTIGINSKSTFYFIIAIFSFWILAYIGSHFILEVLNISYYSFINLNNRVV